MEHQLFGIIISDFDMRGLNGIDFRKSIRKMENFTQFVLLNGIKNPQIELKSTGI